MMGLVKKIYILVVIFEKVRILKESSTLSSQNDCSSLLTAHFFINVFTVDCPQFPISTYCTTQVSHSHALLPADTGPCCNGWIIQSNNSKLS